MASAAFVPGISSLPSKKVSLSSGLVAVISPRPTVVKSQRTSFAPVASPVYSPLNPFLGSPAPPAPARGPSRIAVWLLADLRIEDNAALRAAADAAAAAGPAGALVPVVASGSAVKSSAAADVRERLEYLGSGLVALNSPSEIATLCKRLKLEAVYFNHAVRADDVALQVRVERELRQANIQVQSFWSNVLCEPREDDLASSSAIGLTQLYRRTASNPSCVKDALAAPKSLPKLPTVAANFDTGALSKSNAAAGDNTGKAVTAQRLLNDVCSKRTERECATAGRPDLCFLLKSYLDQGTLSPRMVARHIKKVIGSLSGVTFAELIWRDYMSIAAHRAAGRTGVTAPATV